MSQEFISLMMGRLRRTAALALCAAALAFQPVPAAAASEPGNDPTNECSLPAEPESLIEADWAAPRSGQPWRLGAAGALGLRLRNLSGQSVWLSATLHARGAGRTLTRPAGGVVLGAKGSSRLAVDVSALFGLAPAGSAAGGVPARGARPEAPAKSAQQTIPLDGLQHDARVSVELEVLSPDGELLDRVFTEALYLRPEPMRGELRIRSESDRDTLEPAQREVSAEGLMRVLARRMPGEALLLGAATSGGESVRADLFEEAVPEAPLPAATLATGVYQYRFCLRWPVSLVDAGFGEDFGTTAKGAWLARGAFVQILDPRWTEIWGGHLDASGCSGWFQTSYSSGLTVAAVTKARVGNNIEVQVLKTTTSGWRGLEVLYLDNIVAGASGTKTYVLPETPRTSMIAAAAYTMARFNGGLSNVVFKVNEGCRPDGCCNCASGGEVWIKPDSSRYRKFLIGHELGHRLLGVWTGGYVNDCRFPTDKPKIDPKSLTCTSSGSHGMWSQEYNSCAAMEGWAHFVATAVYNDRFEGENPDAVFRYWSSSAASATVDVEAGPAGGVSRYMETKCNYDFSGMGVELDWLRQWWDYASNAWSSTPGVRPSSAQLMNEIDAAWDWGSRNAYTRIKGGIRRKSGSQQELRWSQYAATNGVDH
jgi:hypothetical protein